MIVSVLRLPVRDGCEEDVARFYADRDVFGIAARIEGFRSGSLLRPEESGAPFLVVAEWEDAAAYELWLASPEREELGHGLLPLLRATPDGSIYSVTGTSSEETA